jgi:hypothetical protein
VIHDDASVEIRPEPDGARITVTTCEPGEGVNGSLGSTETEFHASSDGPLMRFLTTGRI